MATSSLRRVLALGLAGGVVVLIAWKWSSGSSKPYRVYAGHVLLVIPARKDPHLTTEVALECMRRGTITSVGELALFLRGLPSAESASAPSKPASVRPLRVCPSFMNFVRESYLPAVRHMVEDAGTAEPKALVMERALFSQLLACDLQLARLECERSTAFDKSDRSHINLLQQLWVASGKPPASFSPTGKQWEELGFQGEDPTTDLRGGGLLGLRQLVHFAQTSPTEFKSMVMSNRQAQAERTNSWYLVAITSIQFSAELLLREEGYKLYPAHYEVLYDTVTRGTGGGGVVSSSAAKSVSRRSLQSEHGIRRPDGTIASVDALAQSLTEDVADGEAGFFALHHALLRHFAECWARDQPSVMDYNTYMSQTVLTSFFSPSWSPAA